MKISQEIVEAVKSGKVGVMPTDTIYGVVASVFFPEAIERIYSAKGRPKYKRFIYLVSDYDQLALVGIRITEAQKNALLQLWPGPVSIDLKCDNTLAYLHHGQNSLAIRMPEPGWLREFIQQTGPIAATSANKGGQEYRSSIQKIIKDLPDLDFYIEGTTGDTPSRLARVDSAGRIEWLQRS